MSKEMKHFPCKLELTPVARITRGSPGMGWMAWMLRYSWGIPESQMSQFVPPSVVLTSLLFPP
jgi:hypothetical protein